MLDRERLSQLITDGELNGESGVGDWFVSILVVCMLLIAIIALGVNNGCEEESKQGASGSKGESSLQTPSREK